MKKALKFLGDLVFETSDWSCTDIQHEICDELKKF